MKKQKNKDAKEIKETIEVKKYYDLKEDAVEELANAINQKESSQEKKKKDEPNPYKMDRLAKIPTWIKALFVKFWVGGAICYFGFYGLGAYVPGVLDLQVLVGVLTGIVFDFFVNPGFLYFESDQKEFHKFIMLPITGKRLWTLIINIVYGVFLTITVAEIYYLINIAIIIFKDLPQNTISFSVEPLGYGFILLLVDMFFISIKNYIVKLAHK